jgi:hypothetical protein
MSEESTECQRCRQFRGQVALLNAEITSLRESVLALSRDPTVPAPVLEVVGIDQPARLAIGTPFVDGENVLCQVSISYRDHLSAKCLVPLTDPSELLKFFDELAQSKSGWKGEKQISAGDGQLTISCTYNRFQYRTEVAMDINCALGEPSLDPNWSVHCHLDIDPETLEGLAAQAESVFANAAEPLREPEPPAGSN